MSGSATAAEDEPMPARPKSRPSRRDTRRESSMAPPTMPRTAAFRTTRRIIRTG